MRPIVAGVAVRREEEVWGVQEKLKQQDVPLRGEGEEPEGGDERRGNPLVIPIQLSEINREERAWV